MRKRERTAALSAVGLMLIAGCSGGGGRSAGTTGPSMPGGGQGATVSAPHNATLQIMIPPLSQQGPQGSARRSAGTVRYVSSARRHPTWVSPSSAYATLSVVPASGGPTYTTSFALSSCTTGYTASYEPYYNCGVNVPYGSNTFYVSLYDSSNNLLSTNLFASPAPQTVSPNGSSSSNAISIYEQGVVSNINQASPVMCFSAGYQQAVNLEFLDAAGYNIFGPLANPITANFTSYNGAGLGAIGLYGIYFNVNGPQGSYTPPVPTGSLNGTTLYDTSIYLPYLWISGSEGAINLAATVQNIPVYNNGAYTYTPSSQTPVATGTYMAWGIGGSGQYGIYQFALQTSTHQAIPCGTVNGTFQNTLTYVGSFIDPTTHAPYLVASDTSNTIHIYDAYVTASVGGNVGVFYQPPGYGNTPGYQFGLLQTGVISTSGSFINFFTSVEVTGRVNVLSNSPSPGSIDLLNTSNGSPSGGPGSYTTGVALTGATRLTGSPAANVVYYDDPGTPFLYGFYTGGAYSGATSPIASVGSINGQIYDVSPSGTLTYSFIRGATSGGVFDLCEFDAANFGPPASCYVIGSSNTSPSSMAYDPGSGHLMFASGGTAAFAFNVNQSPTNFAAAIPTTPAIYTLAHPASRLTSGLAATPGLVGFYGGPQTSGPCNGSGEITWLQYSSGAWNYVASICWPNHFVTTTYP